MSENENLHGQWDQLVKDWRKPWDELNVVMNRITLAFSKFENPPDEDLELADRLKEQADSAWEKMKAFQVTQINL